MGIGISVRQVRSLMVECLAVLALAPVLATPAHAEGQRVALVVGISGYQSVTPLPNAGRDAHSVGDALRANGFAVTELTDPGDLDRAKLSQHLLAFRRAAQGAEAAVIYFAGHGVEWRGKNWLLPRDASADTPDALEVTALPSSALVNAVSLAGKVRLVVLDACRDNPFAMRAGWSDMMRSAAASRGLARERELPRNVVVLLATQPEERASDGKGTPNSPFAMAFSTALQTPGMRLYQLPTAVARAMRQQAAIEQRPDVQGIFDEPDWSFSAMPAVRLEATAVTSTTSVKPTASPSGTQSADQVGNTTQLVTPTAFNLQPSNRPGSPADPYAKWGLTERDFFLTTGSDDELFKRAGGERRLIEITRAAEAGDAVALTLKALAEDLLARGSREQRFDWYKRAADSGIPLAMEKVGHAYQHGIGVKEDDAEALHWYQKAADLGYSDAMISIGYMYEFGSKALPGYVEASPGMPTRIPTPDYVAAKRWYQKAFDSGNPHAKSYLKRLTEKM